MVDSPFPEDAGENKGKPTSNDNAAKDKENRVVTAEFIGGIIGVGIGCYFTEVELHYWALFTYGISVSFGIDGLCKKTGSPKSVWWVLMVLNLLIVGLVADYELGKSPIPMMVLRWLFYAAMVVFVASGWILYFLARRKLGLNQKISSDVIYKIPDDYTFNSSSGYCVNSKFVRVCAKCLLPPTCVESPLFEVVRPGDSDIEDEFVMRWCCQICGNEYRHDTVPP